MIWTPHVPLVYVSLQESVASLPYSLIIKHDLQGIRQHGVCLHGRLRKQQHIQARDALPESVKYLRAMFCRICPGQQTTQDAVVVKWQALASSWQHFHIITPCFARQSHPYTRGLLPLTALPYTFFLASQSELVATASGERACGQSPVRKRSSIVANPRLGKTVAHRACGGGRMRVD